MRKIQFRSYNPIIKKMYYDFDQSISEVKLGKSIHQFVYDNGLIFDSLMQYTGLKDKNGIEIYEGDIFSKVSISELGGNIQYFYLVKWSCSDAQFVTYQYKLDEDRDGIYWKKEDCSSNLNMVRTYNHVIGNIHDNPELLK